ncbi:Uma2 family endonuclease [Streptomyces rugosispiralis]|uniref:Uma2 family endonuclease n=1 Tax=Streptomyces rugosispiralis TaxID=2967341 RepID=A0ABT1V3C4_9ACTN|nr:Uma2 family endonuclease [Streptomyces rugosispiralis]MCQ8191533.1 Uma2 family endonuclease [Streptomyces rugosispiralis]
MTVTETDRIEMADSDEFSLDEMFDWLERSHVPEGYKVEVVEGAVFMSPQRDVHWSIIRRIVRALEDRFGMDVKVLSDVRIDFPGCKNGFAPDVVKVSQNAAKTDQGRWRSEDVEFVAEVISKDTAGNDYGPKKVAYAEAGVPVYLIADPYTGKCHLFTEPKEGDYLSELSVHFGKELDLTGTAVDLMLKTDDFPRD